MVTIEIHRAILSAADRCRELAANERMSDHPNSAATYEAMAAEFGDKEFIHWLYLHVAERHTQSLVEVGILVRG